MSPSCCNNEMWYKPFRWRRADVRLWRVLVSHFRYKPFMWCRSDVRLRHALSLLSVISPLCGVAPTPDCGIIIPHFSSRGVFQTLVWHQYYNFCSFRSRCHSDPRLAPSIYYLYVWSHWLICSCASCLHLLYLMSELSCEYFQIGRASCRERV